MRGVERYYLNKLRERQRSFQEIDAEDRDRQHGAARLDGLANSGYLLDTDNVLFRLPGKIIIRLESACCGCLSHNQGRT
jgi:hypothetical protein